MSLILTKVQIDKKFVHVSELLLLCNILADKL